MVCYKPGRKRCTPGWLRLSRESYWHRETNWNTIEHHRRPDVMDQTRRKVAVRAGCFRPEDFDIHTGSRRAAVTAIAETNRRDIHSPSVSTAKCTLSWKCRPSVHSTLLVITRTLFWAMHLWVSSRCCQGVPAPVEV